MGLDVTAGADFLLLGNNFTLDDSYIAELQSLFTNTNTLEFFNASITCFGSSDFRSSEVYKLISQLYEDEKDLYKFFITPSVRLNNLSPYDIYLSGNLSDLDKLAILVRGMQDPVIG